MFIRGLFLAAVVYYLSRNIASFSLGDFLGVLKVVSLRESMPADAVASALEGRVCRRDVLGYLSLGWHLGLLGYYYSRPGGGIYTLSPYGKRVLDTCSTVGERCRELLKKVFISWPPLKTLLHFFKSTGFRKDYKKAVEVLGKEMEFWTSKMIEIGLPLPRSTPVKKPYNDYVVRKLFKPLIETLGLGPEDVAEDRLFIAWGRDREPVVAAGVADIVYSAREEVLIAVYIADDRGLELIQRAVEVSESRPKSLTLIISKTSFSRDNAVALKQRLAELNTELGIYTSKQPLHAKTYTNESTALFTSANLNKTSLFRNIEFALLLPEPSITETVKSKTLATATKIL
jgi:hypothetical protein